MRTLITIGFALLLCGLSVSGDWHGSNRNHRDAAPIAITVLDD